MSPSFRIGLLAPSLRGYNALDGGIGAHFADLGVALAAAGYPVTVVTPAPAPASPPLADELAPLDIVPFSDRLPRWLHRLAGLRWRLHACVSRRWKIRAASAALLAAHRAAPLACVESSSTGALALDLLGARHRPPLVVRVSTTAEQLVTHNAGRTDWHDRLDQSWETRLVLGADRVITHTPGHRDEICARWPLDPGALSIIPHGIALPPRGELPPPPLATQPAHILFVGRFEHRKGIDVLLDAVPRVLEAVPRTRFTIAGGDPDRHWSRRFLAEHPSLAEQVSFPGRLSAEALRAAYRECDLFVAPSRYESFGLIYVEAMAWAKPVVGCRVGGIPAVVTDQQTGLLVAPGNAPALAEALVALARDPALRARLGASARADTEARFSRETLARRSVELYQTLAARAT